jgi:phage shock protein C
MSAPFVPRMTRPLRGRVLAGVALAVANHYGWDVSRVRLATALIVLFTGVGPLLYVAGWIAIPNGE